MRSEVDLCRRIAARFDELGGLLREHEDFNREVLPYVFMGDVTRWYVEKWRDNDPVTGAFANWLEGEFVRGDGGTKNVIGVSFVEHLPLPSRKNASDVADSLGPGLRAELEKLRQWRPRDS